MTDIFEGIKTLWNANATLKAALPRIYSTKAPPRADMPYCVVTLVGSRPDFTFDWAYDHCFFQFSIFADDTAEANDIHDKFIVVFDNATITDDDSKKYKMIRRMERLLPDETDEAFMFIIEYEIMKAV